MLTLLEEIERDNWLWEPGEIKVVPLGRPATIADLRRTKLKAEIVNGELLVIGPACGSAAIAAGNIVYSLYLYEREFGGGETMMSRVAFIVDMPHRLSFCPDVSWFTGPRAGAGFPIGAPVFAVEIRDPIDYGDEAERRHAAKRADYFVAGTQVVWDVDVLRERWIRSYHAGDPANPIVFARGEIADAEPAVPGWRFEVDELFR